MRWVLTNGTKARLPIDVLSPSGQATLLEYQRQLVELKRIESLNAELNTLKTKGYVEFTSSAAKAYPEKFDGANVFIEGFFQEITDVMHDSGYLSATGTQEENEVWFQIHAPDSETYVT